MVGRPRLVTSVAVGAMYAWLAPACKPTLDQNISLVTDPIVLAVRSEPAEAAPMTGATYTALYVNRGGPVANPDLRWDFCEARKPLAELGPVNPKCEESSGSWLLPLGNGAHATSILPADACKLFGPDVPPPVEGQPQGRPVDPDTTGGYYDPIRVLAVSTAGAAVTLVETRLSCGAGVIPADTGVEYVHRYHPNENPVVASVSVVGAKDAMTPLLTSDQGRNPVAASSRLALRLAWAACPTDRDACGDGVCGPDETSTSCPGDCATPKGCSGAERFVFFDVGAQALAVQRESIATAWYATGGSFDSDRTGRNAADTTSTTDNGWTAPAVAGPVHMWTVLRDNRGGTGWAEFVFDVR